MKDPTLILTGATGFLGSHLMAALARRGARVTVLGRGTAGESLETRLTRTLSWFGLTGNKVTAIEADLTEPALGQSPARYSRLLSAVRRAPIIHCASDTSFSARHRPVSTAINVDGARSMARLASVGGASCLLYISTAYVGDPGSPLCRETLPSHTSFANIYEETKALAEQEIARSGAPYTILRPSIVCGDSITGRANRFNALYYHVKSLYYIREIYLTDITRHGGLKSRALGIHLDRDSILHLPLRLFLPCPGTINLIPIDYFVDSTLKIAAHPEPGAIHHLTNPASPTVETLAHYSETYLKLKGLNIIYSPAEADLTPAEALFNRFITPYRPYLADPRTFEQSHPQSLRPPPPFTYKMFARCMDHAISANWGKQAA